MKKIKMKDTILEHYRKVHELEVDGLTVRVWKPRTMQQLPAYRMLAWIRHRVEDAMDYFDSMVEKKGSLWIKGNPDFGVWDAQTVYHYDARNGVLDIYFAALLVRPFSREAYVFYCTRHENIDDINQRLMLMWDSREYDREHGFDASYGAYGNQTEWDAVIYKVRDADRDIKDETL